MKFIIDESKWRCGGDGLGKCGEGKTRLLNPEGYSDIIGIIELQLGLSESDLIDKSSPDEIEVSNIFCEYQEDFYFASVLAIDAMILNDDEDISHQDRKKKIIELFAENDCELEFQGKPNFTRKEEWYGD